ncbi:acyclic terpene utilization AtuA family protein [Nisaea sediminum]|uniref:acyclic terpene utilization AtuA family protein n=1 Tax=Nisaea sediminum TaxID=2775867 RepID=UPI001867B501|nr:acyclic terpene utilization AtuA family protein [Nisaea sediminum]
MTKDLVHIGCGAGFAGDRKDAGGPVVDTLAKRDGPKYLIFETLAERTLALAQKQKLKDPAKGYSPFLEAYVRPVLERCLAHKIRIVSNFGAANPMGGARKILEIAQELGCRTPRIAVVSGDDLLTVMSEGEIRAHKSIEGLPIGDGIVAANTYIGARPIAEALAGGADIVVVGRTTDPALVLGPLIHEFGWAEDDWDRLAAGTLAGHLLECGAQVTGAYFADPGFKDVPDLAHVGFPVATIGRDGAISVSKANNTGGAVTPASVKEQILYEMHDPSAYLTADVVLDITGVSVAQESDNVVSISGARGKPRPDTLKTTVSFDGGWLGEAEISYAGPNALARAKLARDVIRERCLERGSNAEYRFDIVGLSSTFDGGSAPYPGRPAPAPDGDFRVRAAVSSHSKEVAEDLADEVLSLYCSGPAGGGGFRRNITAQIHTASILVDRNRLAPSVSYCGAET